jgi:hypothetical protein
VARDDPLPFLPHIERLLLHRRKHRGDLLDVQIRRHARIASALDHRRQLAFLELLQRPGERILDQGPIPVDAMVLVARAVVEMRAVPEVIKRQELGFLRVLLARRSAAPSTRCSTSFWHKVLFDLGHVRHPEPFMKLVQVQRLL